MTPAQARLIRAMKDAVAEGPWEKVNGSTVRYAEWVPTPVFVTALSLPGRPWSVILGVSRAPWTGRQDQKISIKRAMELLADPAALFREQSVAGPHGPTGRGDRLKSGSGAGSNPAEDTSGDAR